ncbi:feruloyl-CoA synthase [Mesorhizobium sp. CAU 1741]|uniref:feruloyl-CoA synthase n=1 Tax=Mesorhizobium sp. CAU 1741 TaxID=3140366 RepID=UPI00325BC120
MPTSSEQRRMASPSGDFLVPTPHVEHAADGTIYVTERYPLPSYPVRVTEPFDRFAAEVPDRVFMADRKAGGDGWRTISYGEMHDHMRRAAQFLLDQDLSAECPLVILSGNDIEHATLALAAMHVGIPYAAVSTAYSLSGGDYGRLKDVLGTVTPGLIYAADATVFGPAANAAAPGVPLIADAAAGGAERTFADILATSPTQAVDRAAAAVTGDTIAKFLFTSGSTGTPKAVINTHRMLCSNQVMTRESFAFMKEEPPVFLDWAPWNHTASGNKVFLMNIFNGGTYYIDDGRPTKADIGKSIRNLKEVSPTWYFNVPTGYDALIPHLKADAELRKTFFKNLKMFWYAGASLAQHSWDALKELAIETTGREIVIGTGLGATETAPAALFCTWPQDAAGNVGLPIPGVTLKLVPFEGKYDARLKGDNITPGYWRQPELSAAAFDEEGFYRLGDALLPMDPDDLTKGFRFDGRTAENFKLDTGTWVATGALRMAVIEHFGDLIRDVAITGADRPYLGALIFPREPEKAADPTYIESLREKLASFAAAASGSSTRIKRLLVVEEPPSMNAGELTDKGSLNQRAVLRNRAPLVEELYAGSGRVVALDGR